MKARLIKNNSGYFILCNNGTIADAYRPELTKLITSFKTIHEMSGEKGNWNIEYPEMITYPGETFAYVTDTYDLVIKDFTPFKCLFDDIKMDGLDDLMTVNEYANMHGKSVEQVKVFCRQGRIPGATKVGRDWLIARENADYYPEDRRITSGKYLRR